MDSAVPRLRHSSTELVLGFNKGGGGGLNDGDYTIEFIERPQCGGRKVDSWSLISQMLVRDKYIYIIN